MGARVALVGRGLPRARWAPRSTWRWETQGSPETERMVPRKPGMPASWEMRSEPVRKPPALSRFSSTNTKTLARSLVMSGSTSIMASTVANSRKVHRQPQLSVSLVSLLITVRRISSLSSTTNTSASTNVGASRANRGVVEVEFSGRAFLSAAVAWFLLLCDDEGGDGKKPAQPGGGGSRPFFEAALPPRAAALALSLFLMETAETI
mmetsp:Transcript_16974/g.51524  ORF Transcript_16974/g.51524 Transcript_16974/m.51524 type:complete len:207 (+) Transcript_16974:2334-2954(+)